MPEENAIGREDEQTCSICLLLLSENGQELRSLACMHTFHETCVDRWLRDSGTCPVCRHRVRDDVPLPDMRLFMFTLYAPSSSSEDPLFVPSDLNIDEASDSLSTSSTSDLSQTSETLSPWWEMLDVDSDSTYVPEGSPPSSPGSILSIDSSSSSTGSNSPGDGTPFWQAMMNYVFDSESDSSTFSVYSPEDEERASAGRGSARQRGRGRGVRYRRSRLPVFPPDTDESSMDSIDSLLIESGRAAAEVMESLQVRGRQRGRGRGRGSARSRENALPTILPPRGATRQPIFYRDTDESSMDSIDSDLIESGRTVAGIMDSLQVRGRGRGSARSRQNALPTSRPPRGPTRRPIYYPDTDESSLDSIDLDPLESGRTGAGIIESLHIRGRQRGRGRGSARSRRNALPTSQPPRNATQETSRSTRTSGSSAQQPRRGRHQSGGASQRSRSSSLQSSAATSADIRRTQSSRNRNSATRTSSSQETSGVPERNSPSSAMTSNNSRRAQSSRTRNSANTTNSSNEASGVPEGLAQHPHVRRRRGRPSSTATSNGPAAEPERQGAAPPQDVHQGRRRRQRSDRVPSSTTADGSSTPTVRLDLPSSGVSSQQSERPAIASTSTSEESASTSQMSHGSRGKKSSSALGRKRGHAEETEAPSSKRPRTAAQSQTANAGRAGRKKERAAKSAASRSTAKK